MIAFGLLVTATIGAPIMVQPGGLGAALESAEAGQALILQPGTHLGRWVITKSIALKGQPGSVLEGTGQGMVVTVQGEGVVLEGLTIRGSGRDLGTDDAVVLLDDAQGATISHCVVEARAFGIYIRRGSGNRVIKNVVRGDATLPEVQRGNGIHLWHTEGNEIRGNELVSTRDGVYLSFAHENRIIENRGRSLRYGIHYMYSERNVLDGNEFTGCVGGIALMFSKGNTIERNRTVGNQRFGILCQMVENSELVGNVVTGNGRGLFLENAANNNFRKNRVVGNGVGLFLTAGSEGNTISDNAFDGNVVQVYRSRSGDNRWSVSQRGNFWSDYAGFDWNGDGVGEQPYRLETSTSSLMANYPAARWLWQSPLMLLLSWWEARYEPPSAYDLDLFPMVAAIDEVGR